MSSLCCQLQMGPANCVQRRALLKRAVLGTDHRIRTTKETVCNTNIVLHLLKS